MNWLRRLCSQAAEEPVSRPETASANDRGSDPCSFERCRRQSCGKNTVPNSELGEERNSSSALLQSINTAFARLSCTGGGYPLYRRINALLEVCRLALGASDARLACFSTNGSAWVFLPSPTDDSDTTPRAAGWGYTPLYGLLSDQLDSCVVLRGYHTSPSPSDQHGLSIKRQLSGTTPGAATAAETAVQQPQTLQSEKRVAATNAAKAVDAVQLPLAQPPWRMTPPDPFTLALRTLKEPTELHPTDLIAIPARQNSRLVAALLLGWQAPPASPQSPPVEAAALTRAAAAPVQPPLQPVGVAADGQHPVPSAPKAQGDGGGRGDKCHHRRRSSSGGMEMSPQVLEQLQLLAQYLVFGLTCDPVQTNILEQVARQLATLPTANGLHDLITRLLDAVPELLYMRFEVRMQPIFLLTHGLHPGSPAVLFANRQQQPQPQGATASTAAAASAGGPIANQALLQGGNAAMAAAAAAQTAVALDTWNGVGSARTGSASGLVSDAHAEGTSDGASRVRAVRISLHHTLLAEALRAACSQAAAVPAARPGSHTQGGATNGSGLGGVNGGAGACAGGVPAVLPEGHFALRRAVSSNCGPNQPPTSHVDAHPLDATSASAAAAAPAAPAPPPLYSTIVPNISAHMLEEGAPCRDLLLCANMAGCGLGSLVLCVEGSTATSSSSCGSTAATAAAMVAALSAGSGASVSESFRALPSQAAVPNLRALSQPLEVLHSQRQFGMYLMCSETLPAGLLRAMASELQTLLGMALYACRDGPLSVLGGGGGRCTWELYSLQEQLLGLNPGSIPGGGGMLLATALAATAVAPLVSSNSLGAPGCSAGPGAVGAPALVRAGTAGPYGSVPGRRAAQGRPMPRAQFAVATSGSQGAGGVRSAGIPRLLPSQMQHLASGRNLLARNAERSQGADRGSVVGGEALEESGEVVAGDVDAFRWMLASSPEVMLEAPAAGPSPLEVMVSSMRSGLSTALTNAMMLESADEARVALNQELAAVRLYDVIGRGGQGVIFHGTLHGLETAVKVIVHRGKGEPLAHDGGGDPGEGANGGEDGAAAAAAAAGVADEGHEGGDGNPGDLSRIRKAKRGAMELVVTGAMSHPNIVQVLASFSDAVMVRCTYRNEPAPRLRLVAKDDPILANWASPGPLNTVVCLEYCDAGTLLEAAHAGAFRPPGTSVLSGAVRPALVPLYTSLLEVALALRYLHSRWLVHCDLKPANVLLKSSARDPRGWTCKLSDFGCVRLMTELPATADDLQQRALQRRGDLAPPAASAASAASQASAAGSAPSAAQRPTRVVGFRVAQPLGTIAYMAPECFVRGHALGASVDIYAFGILMYELLMCRAPYVGIDAQTLPRLVLRQHLRPEFHPLAPPEYCHLAARCWSSHVSRRPTAVQLVVEIEALLSDAQLKEGRKQQQQQQQQQQRLPGGARPSPLQPQPPQPPKALQSAALAPLHTSSKQPLSPHAPSQQQLLQQVPARPQQQQQQLQQQPQLRLVQHCSPAAELRLQPQQQPQPQQPQPPAPLAATATFPATATAVGLVPMEPEVSRQATAAAVAAGLDGSLEVMQLQPPVADL